MNAKFYYLYIILGVVFFMITLYAVFKQYPNAYYNFIPALLLFYLGNKGYREKKDQELM